MQSCLPLKKAEFEFAEYRPEYALETVKLWRQAFQRAMGLEEHNRFDEVNGHLDFFTSIDPGGIQIVLAPQTSAIVGFMAGLDGDLNHLYVHVDWWSMGIGSKLLNLAKERSPDRLELFTFQQNKYAQAFYLSRGFEEVERGYASLGENPWAKSKEQLADIKYRWEP